MKSKYYVYTLAYPESMGGKIFYVGKGSKYRMQQHLAEAHKGVKSDKCDAIREIWNAGQRVVGKKVAEFDSEEESYIYEKDLIASIGSENLTNWAAGGRGGSRPGAGRPQRTYEDEDGQPKKETSLGLTPIEELWEFLAEQYGSEIANKAHVFFNARKRAYEKKRRESALEKRKQA